MAETDPWKELAEIRQALSVLHVDLLLHKGLALSARWKAPEGVNLALLEFDAAGRVVAETDWSKGSRDVAKALGEVLELYRQAIADFDGTRENEYRTRLTQALWQLKQVVFGWPVEEGIPEKEWSM